MLALSTVALSAQNAVTTLAGAAGTPGFNDASGTAALFRFATVSGAVVDTAGNIYVADAANNAIRKITPTGTVSTYAGSSSGVSGSTNGIGTSARFNNPQGIAIDSAGNIYVADTGNHLVRMIDTSATVTTLAGSGSAGYFNASGASAQFNQPTGVAVRSTGVATVVYVADSQNNSIRQVVVSSGAVTTLAGNTNGTSGYVDSTNLNALFLNPLAIASDSTGSTLYVADAGNHAIRKIAISGATATVSTLAGSGTAGYVDGTGSGAQFNTPRGVAMDSTGNVFVSDSGNQVIRLVTSGGVVSLYAGTPQTAGAVDSLATNLARFNAPSGIAVYGTTPVYVVDSNNYTVRQISAAATPTFSAQPSSATATVGNNAVFTASAAGNPAVTYKWQRQRVGDADFSDLAEGAPYTGTKTNTLTITGVTPAMNGDLLRVVAANALATVSSSSAQLTTTLGLVFSTSAGKAGVSGSANGAAADARFFSPLGLAVSSSGITYVADTANNTIRAISTSGVVTTLAGAPGVVGSADGFSDVARFSSPSGVAVDSAGNIYVADTRNNTIRKLLSNGYTTTLAGSPGVLGYANGLGSAASFGYPCALAVDGSGVIYVADTYNHLIRKIATDGTVTTLAGQAGVAGSTDGTGSGARFSYPQGIAVDSSGNVYVADTLNSTIRVITPGGAVTTLAGSAGTTGSADANGSTARFNQPKGIVVLNSTTLLVADTGNNIIRKVTTAGAVTTMAGLAGVAGSTDGSGSDARFNQPGGIAIDSSSNIYVADTQNHTIRRSGAFTAPSITTQPSNTSIYAGTNATFTVAATGVPSPIYQWQRQAAGTSGFVNIYNNSTYSGTAAATLTVLNATQAMSGDQFQVVVSNLVNPNATSSVATLTVGAPAQPPSITTQPSSASINLGATASFSVAATGTGTLTYQWLKNGSSVSGATGTTLSIVNAQTSDSAVYTVIVSNLAGSVTSSPASLSVSTTPTLAAPLRAQVATVGGSVTLTANVSGGGSITYQWRKNGTAISGATNSTLTLSNVTSSDAALYDVIATNGLGTVTSAPAQLSVSTTAVAPVITAQPASQTVTAGSFATLTVAAAAAPMPTYQWRKGGSAISGATNATLTLTGVQATDAGSYDVVVTNSAGSVTSTAANLTVIARSYAGIYFGTFGSGLGSFALYVRPDNSAVFLGAIPSSSAGISSLSIVVNDAGQFSFIQPAGALSAITVSGTIASDGTITGTLAGGATSTLSGSRSSDTGATQSIAGLYLAGSLNSAGNALTIVSATGQAFALVQVGSAIDGGTGAAASNGQVAVNSGHTSVVETITASNGTITSAAIGGVSGTFTGASETAVRLQRLANISTRAKVSGGDSIAIAGFVISGTESKLVLIRAVGPTLTSFGVSGALATPKLDLYRGATLLATNTGVSTSANATAIAAAATNAGAFALGSSGNDSAILTTLAPGAYTAQVSGANSATGVALVEVYDLSQSANGQKLVNISTRASAASGENALIAGVVVTGSSPKRVLIRAVGPGLSAYGVSGVLAQPVLELKTQAGSSVATNTGWSSSSDAAAITSASASVGAFPLAAGDSAMIVTLPPGGYSATVSGSGGATGIALIEIYELQ